MKNPHALASLLASVLLAGCGPSAPPPAATPPSTHAGHEHHQHPQHGADHEHGGPLVHRFEKADDWAKQFDDPARDAWQRPADVIATMKITPGMTVADIGAGTGYFEPHLSRAVGPSGAVLALDLEPDMVRYMTERAKREGLANVKPAVVAGDDPRLAPGSVHRILIVDTWHHIPERPAYARKLAAALAPGGAVFVVDFKPEATIGPPPAHRLTAATVKGELEAGGLRVDRIETTLPEQYVVVASRP